MKQIKCDECGAVIDTGNEQITLRDHFAGLAMQALITGILNSGNRELASEKALLQIIESAYEMADGMIKARSK